MAASKALFIASLTVRADSIVCEAALAPGAPRSTTPELTARVRAAFPDVPSHACVNGEGDTFAAVMERTSLPHLLEHLVISLQVRAAAEAERRPSAAEASAAPARSAASDGAAAHGVVFVGTTEWVDEPAGRARIEVSFADDLVALRAFRDAVDFLNAAVVPFGT